MRLTRRYLAITILLSLTCLAPACPKQSDLDRAAKASREIAFDVKNGNKLVGELYLAGKLSLPAKDKAADLLGKIGDKGEAFNNALIELDKKYPSGTVPPENLQFIKDSIGVISNLFKELFSGLDLFGATSAVKDLKEDVEALEKVKEGLQ